MSDIDDMIYVSSLNYIEKQHPPVYKRLIGLESELEQTKKQLELKSSWVKHHQKSVENALAERNKYKKQLEQTKKKLDVAIDWIERIEVTTRVRENTRANRQCTRALKQINETNN